MPAKPILVADDESWMPEDFDASVPMRDVDHPEAVFVFTLAPAGTEGVGAFIRETKFLPAPAGQRNELAFRL